MEQSESEISEPVKTDFMPLFLQHESVGPVLELFMQP
jgi:hypothetical protein